MQTMTVQEVEARLPEILEQMGTGDVVEIVSNGLAVGRLALTPLPTGTPILGRGKGKLIRYVDDDEHLKDFADYMP